MPCPAERWLARFASNNMGPQRRRKLARHLETCADCRKKVSGHREIARRYRDMERLVIAASAKPIPCTENN